jgi:acyl dehydratase
MSAFHRTYGSPPFAPAYMLHAFRPSPGWASARGCPDLQLTWRGYRVESAAADLLRAVTGIGDEDYSSRLCILYPQVTGFRLVMAMLTHPAWPLPIWNALQVRNRLRLHAPFRPGDEFDLEARVSGWRVLAKGVEIDIHTKLAQRGACRWESIVTFYYRGRFGAEAASGLALGAGATSPVIRESLPENGTESAAIESATWNVGDDQRWRFAGLTGDFNGLHQWDGYARRMGFPAAFPHPQRALGQCLARLPEPGPVPLELDLWIKGPVFFGRDVTLHHGPAAATGGRDFGLWLDGESRPALVGTLRAASAAAVDPPAA